MLNTTPVSTAGVSPLEEEKSIPKVEEKSASYAPLTVKKALSVLTALGEEKEGMGVLALARKLTLNRSTVHRLISAFVESGFVRQDPTTHRYVIGMRILELAGDALARMEVRRVALPFLQELVEATGETVHLGIMDRGDVVFIDKIEGPELVRFFTHVGKRFPAYVTSIGKAIAAYLPQEEAEKILDFQSFEAHTENTITTRQAFKEHLKQIRKKGYAIDNEENRRGVCCLGSPVFDSDGRVVAAVSISGPAFRLSLKKMRELSGPLKATALEISKTLGYRGNSLPSGEKVKGKPFDKGG